MVFAMLYTQNLMFWQCCIYEVFRANSQQRSGMVGIHQRGDKFCYRMPGEPPGGVIPGLIVYLDKSKERRECVEDRLHLGWIGSL